MKGLLLFILACSSFVLVVPLALLAAVLKGKLNFMNYAISIDQTINAIAGPLLDSLLLLDKTKFNFGDMDKTISYNIGRNSYFNNLSKLGVIVNKILDFIDEDHSKDAYEDNI